MTIHIVTSRTLPKKPLTYGKYAGVKIMMHRARNTSERATARMIECLAARLADICERRADHA